MKVPSSKYALEWRRLQIKYLSPLWVESEVDPPSSVLRILVPDPPVTGYKCPSCGTGNIDPITFDCFGLKRTKVKHRDPETNEVIAVEEVWYKGEGCGYNDNPIIAVCLCGMYEGGANEPILLDPEDEAVVRDFTGVTGESVIDLAWKMEWARPRRREMD